MKPKELMVVLEIERSKLNREKSVLVLDKALLLYFSFLFIGVLGFVNGYVKVQTLNLLVLMSFAVLIIGIAPYIITMRREETKLDTLLDDLKGPKNRGGKNA